MQQQRRTANGSAVVRQASEISEPIIELPIETSDLQRVMMQFN